MDVACTCLHPDAMMIGPPPDQLTSGSSSIEDGNQQLNRGVVSPFMNLHDELLNVS